MASPYPSNPDWPANWSKSTVTGKIVGLDGKPRANAPVVFVPAVTAVLDSGASTVVLPASLVGWTDAHANLTFDIPATDDPNINPRGWTYTVTEPGGRTYSINAPSGVVQDLSVVSPVPSSPGNGVVVGPAGPANVLSVGSVGTGAAAASITGTSPAQVLNLTVPQGIQGVQGIQGIQGPSGPANSLTVGTVTTGPTAAATITGAAPNQTLGLTLPLALNLEAIVWSGNLVVKSNALPPGLRIPKNCTLQEVHVRVGTASAGADIQVRVNYTRAGTTTPINTYTITAGTTVTDVTGLAVALNAGDIITFDVLQVGSTTSGADLAVALVGTGG